MEKQFDELSRSLASGVSRREALHQFALGIGSVLAAAIGIRSSASAQGSTCTSYTDCNLNQQCCNGMCISLVDDNNCGRCGLVCPPGTRCTKVPYHYKYRGTTYNGHSITCV